MTFSTSIFFPLEHLCTRPRNKRRADSAQQVVLAVASVGTNSAQEQGVLAVGRAVERSLMVRLVEEQQLWVCGLAEQVQE